MKTAEDVKAFIEYRDSYHKELRGGVVMIFVKNHYKWLTESELLQHWIDHVYQPTHPTLPSDEEIKRKATEYAENENSCYTNDYYGYVNGAKDVRSIASARIAEMERELQEAKNLVRSITEFAEGMKVLDGEALQVLKNTARRVLSDKPTQFPRK